MSYLNHMFHHFGKHFINPDTDLQIIQNLKNTYGMDLRYVLTVNKATSKY